MEIGIDLEKNDRFKKISQHFKNRIFASEEIEYANSTLQPHIHLCAIWCVKEAFVKACSYKNISFKDIKVMHNHNGKPFIEQNQKIIEILTHLNANEIKISISHTKEYSTAVVLVC